MASMNQRLALAAFAPPALTRASYLKLRREYRIARREDRIAGERAAAFRQSPAGMVGRNVRRPDDSVAWRAELLLQPLTVEQRALITATPADCTGRLPRGPKATAIFCRGRMDLNKRVALRRAIAASAAYSAERAA
jgi:hypothetical protein